MVCGSRFLEDPGYKVPIGRRIGNLIFSVVLTLIVRQRITDPTSGFRMTNRRGIELFARDYPHDYPEVEAILMLHAHRLRIHEVPVRMNARGFGRILDRLPAQRLLHGQGPAGDLRRPLPTPARAGGRPARHARRRVRRAGSRRRRERRSRGRERGARDDPRRRGRHRHPRPDRRDRVTILLFGARARARAPAPARRALRAAVDVGRLRAARPRDLARPARIGADLPRDRRARRTRSSSSRSRWSSCSCSTSRSRPRGSARRPRSSPRRSRGSTSSAQAAHEPRTATAAAERRSGAALERAPAPSSARTSDQ